MQKRRVERIGPRLEKDGRAGGGSDGKFCLIVGLNATQESVVPLSATSSPTEAAPWRYLEGSFPAATKSPET